MDEEYIGERTDAQGGRGARASTATRPASRPSRNKREAARRQGRGADGRPGVAGARRPLPRRGQPRAAEERATGPASRPSRNEREASWPGVRGGCGTGPRPCRRGRSGGGQGVITGRTTRDRARAVDATSATTSQTTQARCHTGTSFIHCRRLETYNLISIHNSFYYLLPRECGGQRADEEQQAAGSSSESSNIADVLDELRGASRLSVIGRWRAA